MESVNNISITGISFPGLFQIIMPDLIPDESTSSQGFCMNLEEFSALQEVSGNQKF